MSNKVRLNFYISEEDADSFREICSKTGCTMSEMFRRFVTSYNELHFMDKYIPRQILDGNSAVFISVNNQLIDIIRQVIREELMNQRRKYEH